MRSLPGQTAQQAPQPKWSKGTIERVACPNCGRVNDFRELHQQQLLDTGHKVICESCGRLMEVVAIKVVTLIAVRPVLDTGPSANQARTISPGQLQRLLKGR
jgi:uncharacterized Zn finger protein